MCPGGDLPRRGHRQSQGRRRGGVSLDRRTISSRAVRWYAGLEKAIATLAEMPERHPVADESEEVGITLRHMLYGRRRGTRRLLFSIEGDSVILHHIRHSAQGPIEQEGDD